MDTNEKYYKTAIKWCEDYLNSIKEDDNPIYITLDGLRAKDTYFVISYLNMLKGEKDDDKRYAYVNIRKIKNILEKTKTLVALLK